jgi:subtilisin family serine protease
LQVTRLIPIALLVALVSLLPLAGAAQEGPPVTPADGERVLVRFEDLAQASSVARAFGQEAQPAVQALGIVAVPVPEGTTRGAVIDGFQRMSGVLYAVPEVTARAAAVPNDPFYPGPPEAPTQQEYLRPLGAEEGWDVETGSHSVVIAVLDTGILQDHPDVSANLWVNPVEEGDPDDNDGFCGNDVHGCSFIDACQTTGVPNSGIRDDNLGDWHGSMVASIAGATGDNGIGLAGIAWDTSLMTVKVLNCQGEGALGTILQGMVYAVQRGADVINLSIDVYEPQAPCVPAFNSQALQPLRDTLDFAIAEGVTVVAAAGNHGCPAAGFPASHEGVIGVGSTGIGPALGNRAVFSGDVCPNGPGSSSNYGPGVDVVAPGVQVIGAIFGSINPEGYALGCGTSFSAPLVSGLAALLLSMNPALSAETVGDLLMAAADPLAPDPTPDWAGAGRINIGRTLLNLPSTYEGLVDLDYDNVPAGVILRAYVGNVECGATATYEEGGESRFSIEVRSEMQQAGCGMAGSEVSLRLLNAPGVIGNNVVDPLPQTWTGRLTPADLQFVQRRSGNVLNYVVGGAWSVVPNLRETDTVTEWLEDTVDREYRGPVSLYYYDEGSGPEGTWTRNIQNPEHPVPDYVNNLLLVGKFEPYWLGVDPLQASPRWPVQPLIEPFALEFVEGWNHFVWRAGTTEVDSVLPFHLASYEVWRWDSGEDRWQRHVIDGSDAENDFQAFLEFETYWLFFPSGE